MSQLESIFFWISLLSYSTGSVLFTSIFIFKFKLKIIFKIADVLFINGLIFHTITVIVRTIHSGHFPVMGDYENALAGSWAIMIIFYLVLIKWKEMKKLLLILVPVVIIMLGYGISDKSQPGSLTPPYQSPWLIVHIIFAWFAYASFAIAFAISLIYIKKQKNNPDAELLDQLDKHSVNFIFFGFINETIMIAAGSIWANLLWGSYWNWDPVETWSLICWLMYGLYMHLRYTFNWKGKRAAWLAVIAFITVIVSFWGTNLLGNGLHIFNLIR